MNDREPTNRDKADGDHWEMFAEAMDLTIEGHRLIAQEIVYEAKALWRAVATWLRDLSGNMGRRGSLPP